MAEPEIPDDLDPVEFLRALMRLSPADAAEARARARERRQEPDAPRGQYGPTDDYGRENKR